MRAPFLCLAAALFSAAGLTPSAFAQDTLAQESSRRQAILARLPADAAKRVFGLATSPAPGPARPIGDYTKGCVAGAVQLPADGPNWQVMRPSRNRAWGHPILVGFLPRLAATLPSVANWPGLLVGDIGQPYRGRQDRRLACSGFHEQRIDFRQHLGGLRLKTDGQIVRHLAREVNKTAMNRGHAEPLAGPQTLDHDAARIQPLAAGAAGGVAMMQSRTSGPILPSGLVEKEVRHELHLSCIRCVRESDHVYWQKSTSRKPAFDKEIGKKPQMLNKRSEIRVFCAFLPIFSLLLL